MDKKSDNKLDKVFPACQKCVGDGIKNGSAINQKLDQNYTRPLLQNRRFGRISSRSAGGSHPLAH